MNPASIAAVMALLAAAAWGSGDFVAGLATRRAGPFYTVLISYTVGMIALLAVALARGEAFPQPADLVWGALAGFSGSIGLAFLMRGFASGRMGIVAPVSAVFAAAIPVIFTALTEGLPQNLQRLGFVLALASIWLLSRPEPIYGRPAGLGMALLAGLGFGLFFTLLSQVSDEAVFWPLVSGRLASCVLMVLIVVITRRPLLPQGAPLGLLSLAGVADVLGNLLFLLSVQLGRLDVAAVLVSLYPAVTAILARVVIGEHMARIQVAGVATAVLSIVLITV